MSDIDVLPPEGELKDILWKLLWERSEYELAAHDILSEAHYESRVVHPTNRREFRAPFLRKRRLFLDAIRDINLDIDNVVCAVAGDLPEAASEVYDYRLGSIMRRAEEAQMAKRLAQLNH